MKHRRFFRSWTPLDFALLAATLVTLVIALLAL
jgi:hypothetical protein